MKKNYQKPTMNVVKIQYQSIICQSLGSVGTNLAGDDAIGYGGGGHGAAYSRQNNLWDDDDE